MNTRLVTAILLLGSLLSVSCAATAERSGTVTAIGYVSISSLFDFAVTRDTEASQLRKRKNELLASMKNLDAPAREGRADPGKTALMRKKIDTEMKSISAREEYYRVRILNRINAAVKRVAGRHDMDYILNIGDQVVYARKKYDLTEEVIQEMMQLEKRSEPVSR